MRKFFAFVVTMSFLGICRAQERIYTLYLYTSEYSGPCIKFTKDIQSSPQMKATLEQYNLVEINADTMTKEDVIAMKYYVFFANEYPLFVVVDSHGNIIRALYGYNLPQEFIVALDPSTFGETPYMTVEDFSRFQNLRGQKTLNNDWNNWQIFMYKLYYVYKWKFVAISMASNVSNLSGNSKYKLGYQIGIPIYRHLSRKSNFDTGLFFNSIGAKDLRLNYIMIPVEAGTKLFRIPDVYSMRLSVGAYGAYRVGSAKGYAHFDAGLRAKLYVDMGSYRFWFGYQRGLMEVLPDSKAYNNVFSLGANLYFGR